MSFQLVNVGIAEHRVSSNSDVLRTILGSCVGICLYDPEKKIIGLSHIMLAEKNSSEGNPGKYADTAIPLLIDEMTKAGASEKCLVAKIVGGSTMFKMADNSIMGEIGKNNARKVKEILAARSIPLVAEELGGDYGRTIDFFPHDGSVKIRSLGRPEKTI